MTDEASDSPDRIEADQIEQINLVAREIVEGILESSKVATAVVETASLAVGKIAANSINGQDT